MNRIFIVSTHKLWTWEKYYVHFVNVNSFSYIRKLSKINAAHKLFAPKRGGNMRNKRSFHKKTLNRLESREFQKQLAAIFDSKRVTQWGKHSHLHKILCVTFLLVEAAVWNFPDPKKPDILDRDISERNKSTQVTLPGRHFY